MDKTAKTEFHRSFLIEGLPEPLTRSSSHVQLFDNYIENTRIRLRNVRVPESKEWIHILQQRFQANESDQTAWKVSEMYLNDAEYQVFERFEGREIRKNRYFHEFDGKLIAFDLYIGDLWGLCTARVEFDSIADMQLYEPPPFAVFEISNDPFFNGENLLGKRYDDVRAEVQRLGEPLGIVRDA